MKTVVSLLLCALLGITGCRSPDIVQLSADTYMHSKSSSAGVFANTSKLKATVIREANEFARSKGKVAVAIASNELRPAVGFPSFEYQFRLVDPNDPLARGGALLPRPDVVIDQKSAIEIRQPPDPNRRPDIYTELSKLEDLRKRGIITEAEFEAEKKKLLSGSN